MTLKLNEGRVSNDDRRNWSHRICAIAGELRTRLEQSADDPLKTGFRAKDAKNAKKLLQGELVEFVYESFDVTFEERAINHRCSGHSHPSEESLRSLRP